MNATEITTLIEVLKAQKKSILNKTAEFKLEQTATKEKISDEHEAVSHDLSTNMSIQLHERDRLLLFQIERALGKIEDGTYGQCESCGEYITAGRLKASPFTTLCLACKEEQEDPRNFLN